MQKLAVLLSGSGRTLDNFHACIGAGTLRASIEVVISNVEMALGLAKAKRYGYPAWYAPDNTSINELLKRYDIDLIVLAGYLQLYQPPPELVRSVLNIHPALIPSFCGKGFYGHHVHEAVKAKGCTVSGCTVHFANEHYDEGPIVLQRCVSIAYEDSPDDIADKVFSLECATYPEAINLVGERGIDFFWEREAG
ncbi:MAG: phosphoribosylglycinamide formyltransferase [Desulfobulbus propionicus]|nr:MAG: phosphoribosylglycinamide formyltransferase [Desulfobulbus propionicus]